MPWAITDVEKHKKGLTKKQKEVWVEVANNHLAKCMEEGDSEEVCEGQAIRIANTAAAKVKEGVVDQEVQDMVEAVLSTNDKRERITDAIRERFGSIGSYGPYIRDIWDTYTVYEEPFGKYYSISYKIDDKGKVELGHTKKEVLVQTTYIDIEEANRLEEARTIKAQIQIILKQADALMDAKNLPAVMRGHIKTMRLNLKKSWADLAFDGDPEGEPAEESQDMEIAGDFIALVEGLKDGGDRVKLKIIQPGWGSSGYYPPDVLERDAGVYVKGTQMFIDHQTEKEERERPEGSLSNLAGVLITDGKWDPGGSAGPGIYADAQVFEKYRNLVTELSPYIGVSHRAMGKAQKGEAEGRKGDIINKISAARSVDFVTSPGAGGQILQLFEAAKGQQVAPIEKKEVKLTMTEEEIKALEGKVEALEKEKGDIGVENARLREVMLLSEAAALVVSELKEAKIPDITRQRLTEVLGENPPITDGVLDKESFKARIKESVDSEIKYLSEVTTSGVIRGMGRSSEAEAGALKDAFAVAFVRGGHSSDEAKRLAGIAAAGR